jgi:hypothetical protein
LHSSPSLALASAGFGGVAPLLVSLAAEEHGGSDRRMAKTVRPSWSIRGE